MVKNLPAVWETWVQSVGWEDPLEAGMATHSSVLSWRIPMDRGACWATVHSVAKQILSHWTIRELPILVFKKSFAEYSLHAYPNPTCLMCTEHCRKKLRRRKSIERHFIFIVEET